MKRKILSTILIALIALPLAINVAYAVADTPATTPSNTGSTLTIPKPNTLPGLTSDEQKDGSYAAKKYVGEKVLPTIINVLIGAAVTMSLVFIIVGGIMYLTAYGDDEKLGSAKKTIMFALVGLVIALFSYAIVAIISSISLEKKPGNTTETACLICPKTAYAGYVQIPGGAYDKDLLLPKTNPESVNNVKNLPFADLPEGALSDENFDMAGYISLNVYSSIIKIALAVASILIVLSFSVAGAMYVIAQGDEDLTGKAKKIIMYTLIAVAIIASSYGITLGITKLKTHFWDGGSNVSQPQ